MENASSTSRYVNVTTYSPRHEFYDEPYVYWCYAKFVIAASVGYLAPLVSAVYCEDWMSRELPNKQFVWITPCFVCSWTAIWSLGCVLVASMGDNGLPRKCFRLLGEGMTFESSPPKAREATGKVGPGLPNVGQPEGSWLQGLPEDLVKKELFTWLDDRALCRVMQTSKAGLKMALEVWCDKKREVYPLLWAKALPSCNRLYQLTRNWEYGMAASHTHTFDKKAREHMGSLWLEAAVFEEVDPDYIGSKDWEVRARLAGTHLVIPGVNAQRPGWEEQQFTIIGLTGESCIQGRFGIVNGAEMVRWRSSKEVVIIHYVRGAVDLVIPGTKQRSVLIDKGVGNIAYNGQQLFYCQSNQNQVCALYMREGPDYSTPVLMQDDLPAIPLACELYPHSCYLEADETHLATLDREGYLRVWKIQGGVELEYEEQTPLQTFMRERGAFIFDRDPPRCNWVIAVDRGRVLVGDSLSKRLMYYNLTQKKCLWEKTCPHSFTRLKLTDTCATAYDYAANQVTIYDFAEEDQSPFIDKLIEAERKTVSSWNDGPLREGDRERLLDIM